MATLDWHLDRTGGVTLVELAVSSDTDERVRVESRLEPVWPPRERGVPAAGWDASGFEGTVGADSRLVLGYASPAEPAEPPAELTEPADEEGVDARTLIRTLGEGRPPRDAVPVSDTTASDGRETRETGKRVDRNGTERGDGSDLGAYFEAVEKRLATAERLEGAADLAEAREAVAAAGGLAEVRRLQSRLEADARRLDRLAGRGRELHRRAAGVEIPLGALERVG